MTIDTQVYLDDIANALDWMGAAIGAQLDRRVKNWKTEIDRNPFLSQYYREEFAIEFDLARIRRLRRITQRVPKDETFNIAYGFVVALKRVSETLPTSLREGLRQRLRGSLNDPFGFRPLAYEMMTAAHLSKKGYEFECADVVGSGRFDFLATKERIDIEIECKTTSIDTGRKVHHLGLNRVVGGVLDTFHELGKRGGIHLFDITVPHRLDKNDYQVVGLKKLLCQSVQSLTDQTNDFGAVKHFRLDSEKVTFPVNEDSIRSYLDTVVGKINYPMLLWTNATSTIVVTASSEEKDTFAAAIYDKIKEATNKLTDTRPAVVALQLIDISRDEFSHLLVSPNHLHRIARKAFDRKACIDSLVFSTRPTKRASANNRLIQSAEPALVLYNPAPKFPSIEARELFSDI